MLLDGGAAQAEAAQKCFAGTSNRSGRSHGHKTGIPAGRKRCRIGNACARRSERRTADDPAASARMLRAVAGHVGRLKWHVQVNTAPALIAALKQDFAALPFPLVIDHFGGAKSVSAPGFDALIELVGSGKAYAKISWGDFRPPRDEAAQDRCHDWRTHSISEQLDLTQCASKVLAKAQTTQFTTGRR